MHELTASLNDMAWDDSVEGIRAKKVKIGRKHIRLIEINDRFDHPDWCRKGHTGFVVEGKFILNIEGREEFLETSDVFVFDDDKAGHRHIPVVPEGGRVVLLLIED